MMKPDWLKPTLLLALTFITGVALGVGLQRRGASAHEGSGVGQQLLLHHLQERLDLDSAQHRAVMSIFARHQASVDSAWQAVHPYVRATLDSVLREIAGVLRPDQAETYRKMIQSRHPGVLP
jgi:hypothetical protein